MKKTGLLLPLLICFVQMVSAQNNETAELEKTIENSFREIWSELDESRVEKFYTPEFTLFEDGEVYDLDSVRNFIIRQKEQLSSGENKTHKFERINRFEFIHSETEGNTGWIYYHNFAEFTMDGTPIANIDWLESAVLEKSQQGWKIKCLHSTLVEDKP